MVKLFPHRRRNTVGGGGTATSSPHPAIHRRGSDGSAAACPSRLSPPPATSLFVDPVLAEAMAGVIKAMQRPSKLSSDHFEAALGIAAIGADSFREQALFVSNSSIDRKFCASVISKWAESRGTTSKKKATPLLPSKVVADLLCKAAGPLSRRACPGQWDAIERQLELGLQRRQRPGHGEAVAGSSSEEEAAVPALGPHFYTVASALLSALRGRGWGYGNGGLDVRNMDNGASSNSSGNWGGGVTEAWATTSEGLVVTRPAVAPAAAAVSTEASIFSFSTARATAFSASFTISTPPSSSSASSTYHSHTKTAATPSTGDSFSPFEDDRRRQHGHNGNQGQQPPPPPPPRLFIAENSVSRLAARAFKAEKESSMSRASLERLTGHLRDVQGQLRASESKSAAYASALERVSGQLTAAEAETSACKERLKQACSYIRKLAAEKNNTDMLVAECHLRVKSMEESVLAAVLQMEDAGAGVAVAAANSAASDDEFFHDSIGAEGEKEAAGENPSARDVSLRIAVRSDVSSARRRAPRGDSAYSCSDTGTSSLSSSSSLCASGGSGVGDDRQPAVAPEDKAALDETFSALARKVDTSAVRAEVLSDIAAARRAKASAHASDPDCSNSGAGSDGGGGVGRGVGSNESGDAETSPLAILAAERDQFEKKKKAGEAPVLHRHDSQSSLFPSPPSMHGTPANNPAGVKVNAGVTKRKDEDDHDHDHDKVSKGISISNGLLCANVAHGTPSAAENEAVNRRPSTGNFGKRGPSIAERLRAAAAGPAIKLTTATRVGFGIGTPSSAKEERDLLVLLESPHRGGVRASAAADAATGGAEGEAGIHATAKKKPFRFHPFRQSLSLHPGSAAGDVLAGEGPAGAPAGAGNGGRPAGAGAWVTIDSNEGDRARSLLLRRHGLEFLKDVRAPRRWRKVGAAERVGCGVVGEVFPLQFDDPVQQHAVRDFTNGVGLVAKRVFKNATKFGKASFAKEVEILSSFISPGCHENIVLYLWVNPNPGVIVMEAAAFDLQALLVDKRKLFALPRARRMGLVADAVRGLSYLHKHANITHGDVKAANMMVNDSCTVLKLCDFGLSGRSHKDKVAGCTPLYASPEVVTSFVIADPAVMRPSMDTYSVGLVALQVLDIVDEPRTSRFADELDGQPARLCDLRDTLLEPWLWDARGGLRFEEGVTKLMMAWLSKFPPHRPPLGTLEKALENGTLWSRASPEQQRQKLLQRRQEELEMW